MSSQQAYLRYAEQCRRMAESGDIPDDRAALEEMARTWRRLADEEEKVADLVRALDQLLPRPVKPARPFGRGGTLRALAHQLAAPVLYGRSQH